MASDVTGWNGVFSVYPLRKLWKGAIIPFLFLVVSIVVYFFGENHSPIDLMNNLVDIIISGFPSIIGFVLTGYALIIGFSGTELVGKMACIEVDQEGHSYFEVVSSIFAVVLGVVVLTYIIACLVSYALELQILWPFDNNYADCFNTVCFFIFLFLFYYSLFALLDIIVNVFNIGQYANAVAQNKLREENTKNNNLIAKILKYIFSW
jgi:hypothetical protein